MRRPCRGRDGPNGEESEVVVSLGKVGNRKPAVVAGLDAKGTGRERTRQR